MALRQKALEEPRRLHAECPPGATRIYTCPPGRVRMIEGSLCATGFAYTRKDVLIVHYLFAMRISRTRNRVVYVNCARMRARQRGEITAVALVTNKGARLSHACAAIHERLDCLSLTCVCVAPGRHVYA